MSEARDSGQPQARGWLSRLVYFLSRRRFGRVLPAVALHGRCEGRLLGFSWMTLITGRYRHLPPQLGLLAQLRVASLIECDF